MKAKLIKKIFSGGGYEYILHLENEKSVHAKSGVGHGWLKLSKQNCDEIFGVVDEDKKNLYYYKQVMNPYETGGQSYTAYEKGFIEGFNKAMELNKDKLFTVEELRYAFYTGMKHGSEGGIMFGKALADEYVQSLQQPTEIEVEIEMFTPAATYGHSGWHEEPKLDENGCLILKKL
jgi:hypothetical protein